MISPLAIFDSTMSDAADEITEDKTPEILSKKTFKFWKLTNDQRNPADEKRGTVLESEIEWVIVRKYGIKVLLYDLMCIVRHWRACTSGWKV